MMRRARDHAAGRNKAWPGTDAGGASGTRPGSGGRSAAPPGPRARGGGASPERSAGAEAAPGFERGQAAPRLHGRPALVSRLQRPGPRTQHRQQGQRPHGQGALPLPPGPTPDCILIHTHCTCGGFNAARVRDARLPAAWRPFVSKPVSSSTSTASGAPRCGTRAWRRSSRTASGSYRARRRRC